MVAAAAQHRRRIPFTLAVSGEAGEYADVLAKIIGPSWLRTCRLGSDDEVLQLVQAGQADAVVLDEGATQLEVLQLLRMIRRLNQALLVVLLAGRPNRRWLEEALRLAAFSVVTKPLQLEELLVQIHRMMVRLELVLRRAEL
jgi:DNA-binding NtrC family response regulator